MRIRLGGDRMESGWKIEAEVIVGDRHGHKWAGHGNDRRLATKIMGWLTKLRLVARAELGIGLFFLAVCERVRQ